MGEESSREPIPDTMSRLAIDIRIQLRTVALGDVHWPLRVLRVKARVETDMVTSMSLVASTGWTAATHHKILFAVAQLSRSEVAHRPRGLCKGGASDHIEARRVTTLRQGE